LDNYIGKMSGYMSYLTTRREVLSNNVSNSNTPHYKEQDVVFHDELEKGLAS